MKRESNLLLAAAIAAVLLPHAQAMAQTGLEEIVVTAQRREQSLQDVAVSVSAITGEAFQEAGFSNIEDMSSFVPNLFMSDGFTGQNIRIRGIGTSTGNEAFEQAVATFSDGIYYGRDNLGQAAVYDVERVEVVRGPQPAFAGQSATAGAINIITRKPGKTWAGEASVAYGTDEESSFDAAIGGPVTDTFGVRFAGRYYALDDAGYTSLVGNIPQGVKENKSVRMTALWQPNDNFDATFKYEYQDVFQRGVGGEFTVCETRAAYSRSLASLAPGLPGLCALDVLVNGNTLSALDGKRGTGGSKDVRAAVDQLNALNPGSVPVVNRPTSANPASANYWGYLRGAATLNGAGQPVSYASRGIEDIARGLNTVDEYGHKEDREFQADIAGLALNWRFGGLSLSSNTSYVTYDKEDWLDPDDSSFAVYTDHRLEDFEQVAEELRLTSGPDQAFTWMAGLYYQKHKLNSRIDVYLPWVSIAGYGSPAQGEPYTYNGGYVPVGTRATAFGGTLTEDSRWMSAFFAGTWNVADAFRINVAGRYQDVKKTGVLPATVAFLAPGATSFSAFQPIPAGYVGATPARGEKNKDGFLPEVGFEVDIAQDVMAYAKYAEAFKAGGFVMQPPTGGSLPDPFTFEAETAKGYEVGIKSRLFDNRLEVNTAAYYTKYDNLQLNIFISQLGRFITTNAGASHTQGIEFDGRAALTDNFTLGFSGALAAKAEYDVYSNASCNSLEAKLVPPPCQVSRAGVSLPFSPEWSFSLNPDYRIPMSNGYQVKVGGNIRFSDGYNLVDNLDSRLSVGAFERVDLRVALVPEAGNWEVAVYGQDLTDNRVQYGAQPDTFSKSNDLTIYDATGITRERGSRYGINLTYRFGN